jgi:hypothetical protein
LKRAFLKSSLSIKKDPLKDLLQKKKSIPASEKKPKKTTKLPYSRRSENRSRTTTATTHLTQDYTEERPKKLNGTSINLPCSNRALHPPIIKHSLDQKNEQETQQNIAPKHGNECHELKIKIRSKSTACSKRA